MIARRAATTLLIGAIALGAVAAPRQAIQVERVGEVVLVRGVRFDAERARPLLMDVAFPAVAEGPLPAVLFLHGGAFRGGDRAEGEALCRALAEGGYLAASIDYRVAPADPYPAAALDVDAAVRFLQAHAAELDIDPERIGLVGAKAGGHLATLVALAEDAGRFVATGAAPPVRIRCAAAISGSADLAAREDFAEAARTVIDGWIGAPDDVATARRAREASPVTWASATDPPILLIHGSDDPMVPAAQPRRLAESIRAAGGRVELQMIPGGHDLELRAFARTLHLFLDVHLGGRSWRPETPVPAYDRPISPEPQEPAP